MRIGRSHVTVLVAALAWLAVGRLQTTSIQGASVTDRGKMPASQAALNCDLNQYQPLAGLTASVQQDLLSVSWTGQDGADVRMRYAIDNAKPVVRDIAVRKQGGQWATLAENLSPEYHVVSGIRRFSGQQAEPLRGIGQLTPERMEKEKWFVYRDAPLYIAPAAPAGGRVAGNGRAGGAAAGGRGAAAGGDGPMDGGPKPEDIRRASAAFKTTTCGVKTDGARLEVKFNGLSMGIFSGDLQFTVYRGTNLIRMDAIAKTNEPSVAYKFDAGLSGFSVTTLSRVTWNDIGGHPQQNQFGGLKNEDLVPVKAQHRVLVAEGRNGSLATFPPPHAVFWARQAEENLGYVFYRKDSNTSFSMGTRQPEQEGKPQYYTTFPLINARPGTLQHMGAYFYASPLPADATRQAVLGFTHGDVYKPLAGYKTMVNHLHLGITARLRAAGSLDGDVRDIDPLKSLGVNIVGMSEFHGDPLRSDSGAGRFPDQADYAKVSAKLSDKDFLVTPWEEPSAYFGGHYNIFWPKSVLWSKTREPNQPFTETHPKLGKVYHAGNAEEMQRLLEAEGGYWYHAHPRTKGTAGYPDATFDEFFVKNDRYLGVAYKMGMGDDLSDVRSCEWRCFDTIDTMNNMNVGSGLRPKVVIADIDSRGRSLSDVPGDLLEDRPSAVAP
jgi:hypothetical protein